MTTAIVTDSTSDLPNDLITKKSINVIPAILIINGKSLEDGSGITRRQFYEQIPEMKTPPTTATPSAGTFHEVYERLLQEGYESIISVHVSNSLSGIFNTAELAAKRFDGRVTVFDSGQLTLGLGFQVLAAAEAALSGRGPDQIKSIIEDVRERIRVFAMLDTLEYVRRSGRVSWARARIGSFFRIKPFLEVKDGQVYSRGQARTRKKGVQQLLTMFHKFGPVEKLAVLHTNAKDEAQLLLDTLNKKLEENPLIVNVTTIIGTHVGPNGLGFALVLE